MNKKINVLIFRRISLIFLFSSIFISIIGFLLGINILGIIGSILLTIFVIMSVVFWRCPFCKKRLPMRFDIKNNVDEVICPYCEANLLYGEDKR
ncbi:hypothetical protein [uncultured Clostridium sp.]|uniref:hypothetical protein n=1 Tax=uncultured Clostridium sp. TaxID=59620 RepID=UPI002582B4C2|nr:hypothetical protein [uncultured Clostridium sp.]